MRRVLVGVAVPVGLFAALMLYLDQWGQRERAQKADCIIVLGAKVRPDGQAGTGLRGRVVKAVELYRKGYAPNILFTGGLGDYPPEEARVGAKLARSMGVPQDVIAMELQSHSTWENARNATQICRAHGWKSAVVVSDPFHLWRARRDFARCGLTVYTSPTHSAWLHQQPYSRLYSDAREVFCVLRDWLCGAQ